MTIEKQATYIYKDHKIIPWEKANIHLGAHAIHYGSSLFEGIRSYQAKNNKVIIFRLKDHIDRLFDSIKIYRYKINFSKEEIIKASKDLLIKNNLKQAYLRPIVYFESLGFNFLPQKNEKANCAILAYPAKQSLAQSIDACFSSWNRIANNTLPTKAKAAGNYLSAYLIAKEANQNGYDTAIALDSKGEISEGAGQNIFIVKNNKLFTPSSNSSILNGITRDSIIKIAKDLNIVVIEKNILREDIYLADECFLTATASELTHVKSVDKIFISKEKDSPIYSKIKQRFFSIINANHEDNHNWIEFVKK